METKATKYKINVTNHSKQGDHVEYLIKLASEEANILIEFLERYSNLKTLHDKLRSEHTSSSSALFPNFPPKKFFGSTDSKFLIQRQDELNKYFVAINSSVILYMLPSYQSWIESILQKHLGSSPIKDKGVKDQKKEIQEKQMMTPEEMKKKVDHYSKQFYDFFSNQLDEKEEDDIERDYEEILKDNSFFKEKVIEESQLFTLVRGRDNNNLIAFEQDNELLKETECKLKTKLNKVYNLTQNEIPTLYFVENLIIAFKV